ncbi:MAG TPA: VWA domain-containing protein [Polyangiaceae bacterium]|nr:VWA domain-containing protein [Polyangiaceae bacterium]
MIFAGLPLAQLALLFGAAALGVGVLYLLKLRRRVVVVPFSLLWQRILRDKETTTLFARLKRVLSLLLQLALLALLVLALGDPRPSESLLQGRTMVVLVDASASMQATDVRPTRLAAARDEVKKIVEGLGAADEMLVAQMDAMVTPLGPMTADTVALERQIEAIRPTDARADFPRALRFATDVLRGSARPEIVVVSDGALGPAEDSSGGVHLGDAKLSYLKIGKEGNNVGITEFSVRRYPLDKSRYEVMLEITNTGPAVEDVELQLLGDGALVDLTKLRLKPAERLPRFYPQLSGASRTLEAKIARVDGTHDELAVDDHAFALLPERRRAKVLVVTEGDTYLEAALLLDEYLDVTDVAPAAYVDAVGRGGWDVVIFDRVTPAQPPPTNALYLDPTGPGSPVKVGRELKAPGFDKIDRKHPALRFLALDDVNVSVGHALVPENGDKVLGASDGGASPILVAGTRGGHRFLAMGFDVRDSDLPLRPAWPLFVIDTIGWFVDEDAQYISSYRTGDVWRVPVSPGADRALLKLPDGSVQSTAVHEGRAVMLGEQAGFYDLTTTSGGPSAMPDGSIHTSFAANMLDASESAITPRAQLVVDGLPAAPVVSRGAGVRRNIWVILLLAAAALTALEWATYHRRVTV